LEGWRISKLQKQLDEEKRQDLSIPEKLLHVHSEQEEQHKELSKKVILLSAIAV
jgi:hypothetical protein